MGPTADPDSENDPRKRTGAHRAWWLYFILLGVPIAAWISVALFGE